MHPNAQRVQAELDARGAPGRVIELADSAGTAAEAAAALGTTVAQIVKSLVFQAGDEPVLVLASGSNRVSTTKIGERLGKAIRRADAEAVRAATGFPIGGVPPIAHSDPIPTLIDEDLFQYGELWAAAGTPHAVFPITPAELARVTGGEIADIRE